MVQEELRQSIFERPRGSAIEALVVFQDHSGHPLDFLLHKDFKHCFVCVQSGAYWIEVNNIKNEQKIRVMSGTDFDMENFYRNQGNIVVLTRQRASKPSRLNIFYGSLMVANCVGMVKSVLSINTFDWTPYQLYKELTRGKKEKA